MRLRFLRSYLDSAALRSAASENKGSFPRHVRRYRLLRSYGYTDKGGQFCLNELRTPSILPSISKTMRCDSYSESARPAAQTPDPPRSEAISKAFPRRTPTSYLEERCQYRNATAPRQAEPPIRIRIAISTTARSISEFLSSKGHQPLLVGHSKYIHFGQSAMCNLGGWRRASIQPRRKGHRQEISSQDHLSAPRPGKISVSK